MVTLLAKRKPKPKPTPFGLRLRAMRTAASMTQQSLADAVKVNRAQLAALETDPDANPTISTVQKLAAALRCKVADLIPDTADPPT